MKTFGGMSHIFFNISHAVRCPVCLSSDHTKFSHACKKKCYNNTCQLCKSTTHNNRPCPKVLKRLQIVGDQPDRHSDRPSTNSSQGNRWLSGPPSFVSSHTATSELAQTVASLQGQIAELTAQMKILTEAMNMAGQLPTSSRNLFPGVNKQFAAAVTTRPLTPVSTRPSRTSSPSPSVPESKATTSSRPPHKSGSNSSTSFSSSHSHPSITGFPISQTTKVHLQTSQTCPLTAPVQT